jgi:ketosteroid isomerase-like protein
MGLTTEELLEIQGLTARYSHSLDGGDVEAFLAIFTENGVVDFGPAFKVEGQDALREFVGNFQKTPGSPRHVVSNVLLEGDGDHATIKAYVHLFALAGDPPSLTVTGGGVYNDTVTKQDGRWKFVRREFTAQH